MLERVQDAPAQTLALRASGTVMAGDIEAAIGAALGEAATGLVMIIDPDFEGYFAEMARGLASAALAHKSLVKLAVVTGPERMDEARRTDFEASPVPIRLVARTDEKGATHEIQIPLRDIMNRKAPDVTLQARDVLYVPDSSGRRRAVPQSDISC